MKIVNSKYNLNIEMKEGITDVIIIENPKFFYDIVNNIYIQAKQWALNQTVGRPEIQKFVDALTGKQAQKGLFITTASIFIESISVMPL